MEHADEALIRRLFPDASKSTLARNAGTKPFARLQPSIEPVQQGKRIRQSQKPKMNKLEAEFYETIKNRYPNFPPVRIQAKTFLIANGCRYTPDFTVSSWPQIEGPAKETAFEVKGKHSWDDAMVKLKVFAFAWPEIRLILVWKQNGEWRQQVVLP